MLTLLHDRWRYHTYRYICIYDSDFYMREPLCIDKTQWLSTRNKNYAHLQPFEVAWANRPLRDIDFVRYYRNARYSHRHKLGRYWLIFTNNHRLIGAVNYYNWHFGMYCSSSIGYWMDKDYTNQHIITRAIDNSIKQLMHIGIRRIEACILAHNIASRRVLEYNNFTYEGTAKQKLHINHAWQDHEIWARIL